MASILSFATKSNDRYYIRKICTASRFEYIRKKKWQIIKRPDTKRYHLRRITCIIRAISGGQNLLTLPPIVTLRDLYQKLNSGADFYQDYEGDESYMITLKNLALALASLALVASMAACGGASETSSTTTTTGTDTGATTAATTETTTTTSTDAAATGAATDAPAATTTSTTTTTESH